ncbi:acetylglutamate kinase [Aureibaculum sp. 2210JD6-5]|uniref:acetylglutamate kinase n=1 Tax=Aureibaculum sp. 2210JD6-5 TaxID=3103957 RepID=UPI002AAC629C|nr:acetylglutamate kinase [Aureibaculum sp. 2210JD6-5]MDY7396475.1 acetylglutamate kinase [Aureibaculum sp. 2210JD6-5]
MKQKLNIIKIGGNVIDQEEVLHAFLADFSKLDGLKILVHGGGKKATDLSNKLQLEPKMVGGRRITDAANLEVVTMVYAGLLNKNIVANLQKNNCNAIGLSGADGNTIKAHKRIVKEVDYGFAGDVDSLEVKTISTLINAELTPVFCAITHDKNGQLLNTNADTIASELASALAEIYEVSLTYIFEKKGVLKDIKDENSVIEKIDSAIYNTLKNEGVIADGMLPKLENCFNALIKGVSEIHIANTDFITNKNTKHTTLSL